MKTTSYIPHLIDGGSFTESEAQQLCQDILEKNINEHVTASILALLSSRPYSLSEILGFRKAIKEKGIKVKLPTVKAVDVCGTGGDGKKTFNISTASAFVIASLGYPVIKHGNYAVSSSSGSSDILQSLGYQFSTDESKLSKDIEKAKVCFLHAPLFYSVMKEVAPVRKNLGIKTIFNVLGPLLNPADVDYQVSGVYDVSVFRLYHQVFSHLRKDYFVVHSLDGHDEVSLTAKVRIQGNDISAEEDPDRGTVLGAPVQKVDPINLQIGTRNPNELFRAFLEGQAHPDINEVVSMSAALAIFVTNRNQSLGELKERALSAILSGQGATTLKKLLS